MSNPVISYEDAIWWLLREHTGDFPPDAESLPEVRLVADIYWHGPEKVVSDMRKAWRRLFDNTSRYPRNHVRAR